MLARTPPGERRPNLPLRLKEQLDLCNQYPERVLFLDIETTGLSHHYDEITVIGWSIGGKASTMVKGDSRETIDFGDLAAQIEP